MKEYFIIHYHNPDGENRYFTDPTFYSTEADARAHIKKDVYAMIERYEYSNSDLLKEIFNAFCTNTDCEKCHFYDYCYCDNPYDLMDFDTLNEQKQLEICATMARQFEEARYEDEDE